MSGDSLGQPMPPSLNAQTEKPLHYSYLKEFRVEPCPLFKQHQCQQHRPYTCFHWHFGNQRRRRPVRRRDGTFNYSPDIYCTKYDENTGLCPDGDDCPYLHRVAGDVERKYHLRYYKTALCVHPTDAKGQCVKNGAHCAFAHSPEDVRQPIFDIREIQQNGEAAATAPELLDHKDRTSFVVEDPVWQEQSHVLACYKTEACKKPPRLCRQGYACPFFHNAKDRRRPPGLIKYRSTPCPAAKAGDEWAESEACDGGERCGYCHSRTEQQFHPEIYKSTKCNDMLQHGYCPRGPFCAFAHTDKELHADRTDVKRPDQCPGTLHNAADLSKVNIHARLGSVFGKVDIPEAPIPPHGILKGSEESLGLSLSPLGAVPPLGSVPSYSAVLKQAQTQSSHSLPKAPGFERDQGAHSPTRLWTPEIGPGLGLARLRTTSLNFNPALDTATTPSTPASASHKSSSFSPYHTSDKPIWPIMPTSVDSSRDLGLGSLIEDLTLEDPLNPMDLSDEDKLRIYGSTEPVSIPGAEGLGLYPGSGGSGGVPFRMSGSFGRGESSSGMGDGLDSSVLATELARAKDELASHRAKLTSWEDGLKQARQACEAWKREAENARRRAAAAESDRGQMAQERDSAVQQLALLRAEYSRLLSQGGAPALNQGAPTLSPPPSGLPTQGQPGPLCARCGRHVNSVHGNGSCPVCAPKAKPANGLI